MTKPWWYPKRTDHEWCERKRKDYPENAGLSDDALRDKYADGCKYQTLWDHVGEAREEHEKLADAYLALEAQRNRYRGMLEHIREQAVTEDAQDGDFPAFVASMVDSVLETGDQNV